MHNSKSYSKRAIILTALGSAIAAMPAMAQLKSFTGAEGFGDVATGGRTGTIYHVTNLNDSGAGSFRDAVSGSNRIIVFDVGGYIHLATPVSAQSNLTILGQTAPGGGIGVYGAEVSFNGRSNEIVQQMRFRDGTLDPADREPTIPPAIASTSEARRTRSSITSPANSPPTTTSMQQRRTISPFRIRSSPTRSTLSNLISTGRELRAPS